MYKRSCRELRFSWHQTLVPRVGTTLMTMIRCHALDRTLCCSGRRSTLRIRYSQHCGVPFRGVPINLITRFWEGAPFLFCVLFDKELQELGQKSLSPKNSNPEPLKMQPFGQSQLLHGSFPTQLSKTPPNIIILTIGAPKKLHFNSGTPLNHQPSNP